MFPDVIFLLAKKFKDENFLPLTLSNQGNHGDDLSKAPELIDR